MAVGLFRYKWEANSLSNLNYLHRIRDKYLIQLAQNRVRINNLVYQTTNIRIPWKARYCLIIGNYLFLKCANLLGNSYNLHYFSIYLIYLTFSTTYVALCRLNTEWQIIGLGKMWIKAFFKLCPSIHLETLSNTTKGSSQVVWICVTFGVRNFYSSHQDN